MFMAIYTFFMWYHKVRGKDYSWFTTEKCIAIASVFYIGLALARVGTDTRVEGEENGARP